MEDDQNGGRPEWRMTEMEGEEIEDDLESLTYLEGMTEIWDLA